MFQRAISPEHGQEIGASGHYFRPFWLAVAAHCLRRLGAASPRCHRLASFALLSSLPSPRCPRLPALALLHTPLAAILSIGCHHLAAMTQLASPCSRRVAPVASPLSPRCPHLAALALLCSPRCAHLAVLTLLPSSCPARRAPPGSSRMQEHRLQGVSWQRLTRRAASSSWTCVAVRSTAHADGPAHP